MCERNQSIYETFMSTLVIRRVVFHEGNKPLMLGESNMELGKFIFKI